MLVDSRGAGMSHRPKYVKTHTSGPIGNTVLAGLTVFGALMAVVVIPLEIMGG
jgi:hypothetical protein